MSGPLATTLSGFATRMRVSLAIGDWETTVEDWDGIALEYHVPKRLAEHADRSFRHTKAMMEFLSEYTGMRYPWPEYRQVCVDEYIFGGMENITASTLNANTLHDERAHLDWRSEGLVAHEAAHQWFGDYVTCRDWSDIWLHEGFATYAESLYLENLHGREAADEHFHHLRKYVRCDSRLIPEEHANFEEAYSFGIYVRGAWVMNTLRHFVDDDEAWFESLRSFQREFRYDVAETADFQRVLERVTKRDWQAFFDQWIRGSGYPQLKGEIRVEGQALALEIENKGSCETQFTVPITLRWREGCSEVQRSVELHPGSNRVTIETTKPIEGLQLVGLRRILGNHRIRVH